MVANTKPRVVVNAMGTMVFIHHCSDIITNSSAKVSKRMSFLRRWQNSRPILASSRFESDSVGEIKKENDPA